jgi:hypothetical protein
MHTITASRAKNTLLAERRTLAIEELKYALCLRKLAANFGVCASPDCLVFSIVTLDEGFKIG